MKVRHRAILTAAALFAAAMGYAHAAATQEQETRFRAFLSAFRDDALRAGINAQTYDSAIANIDVNTRVQELNERQPEFVRPVWDYLAGAVSNTRIVKGREMIAANEALFSRLQNSYGVKREVLTAIWGLESNYGQNTGTFNIFEALATLAYDGGRTTFGRRQLIAALKIAQEQGRNPATMTSSWAGAMGHTQFIPTTYLEHAVDGDGDGKRDVWDSPADALASAANYLKESGWRGERFWGEEAKLPASFPFEQAESNTRKTLDAWGAMGVTKPSGEAFSGSEPAFIFLPAGHRGPAFLATGNFNAILRYNNATSYALAVGMLSDQLGGGMALVAEWPRDEFPLDARQNTALQEGLTALGFDTGGSDGVFGQRSRTALREYQRSRGLAPDGFPTPELLTRILNERGSRQ